MRTVLSSLVVTRRRWPSGENWTCLVRQLPDSGLRWSLAIQSCASEDSFCPPAKASFLSLQKGVLELKPTSSRVMPTSCWGRTLDDSQSWAVKPVPAVGDSLRSWDFIG